MNATIEMYQAASEWALRKTGTRRSGRQKIHVWIAKYGPFWKVCPSEMSAARYLEKNGFRYEPNSGTWEHVYRSENEILIENHYKKAI